MGVVGRASAPPTCAPPARCRAVRAQHTPPPPSHPLPDERSQYDLLEDLPGGMGGLKGVVDALHARGVRAGLPLNPWDTGVSSARARACVL